MRVLLGGVRGTSPVSHPAFRLYGGATTCVLVDDEAGGYILLDAGTGLGSVAPRLGTNASAAPFLMLFTHYHLDHIIGLPTFAPLYDPERRIVIAAPARLGITAEMVLKRLMAAPFWPVGFQARPQYVVLPEANHDAPFFNGRFAVRWCAVHHPDGCHAYRIDVPDTGAAMVFATDLEWGESTPSEREALLRLCTDPGPVDLLIMDGQFDSSDGARFKGWGHSTWQAAVEVASAVGAGQLIVTHHAPEADDAVLTARAKNLAVAARRAGLRRARLGREGMELHLVGRR